MLQTTAAAIMKQPKCITNACRRISISCIWGNNRMPALSAQAQASRHQSSFVPPSNAIHKLKAAVEVYRINNFSEELPSRCKKQIVNAAAASDTNGRITSEGMWTIVNNIGAENFISKHDIESIFDEVAVYDGDVEGFTRGEAATIDVDAMLRIL